MAEPFICVGSDGYSFSYDKQYTKTNPHPRNFATFPQFFQTVREKQLMSIQDAVYKATALPAQILGLCDRGQFLESVHNKTARQCLAVLLARERSLPAEGLLNAASIRGAAL